MGLKAIEIVSVPVSDQQRAKQFYADKLASASSPMSRSARTCAGCSSSPGG